MDPFELPERDNPRYHIIIVPVARPRKPTQKLPREELPAAYPPIVIIDRFTPAIPRERALMTTQQDRRKQRRPWWKFW